MAKRSWSERKSKVRCLTDGAIPVLCNVISSLFRITQLTALLDPSFPRTSRCINNKLNLLYLQSICEFPPLLITLSPRRRIHHGPGNCSLWLDYCFHPLAALLTTPLHSVFSTTAPGIRSSSITQTFRSKSLMASYF